MNTRTWPYGTKRKAKVVDSNYVVLVLEDAENKEEAYVLVNPGTVYAPGTEGELTFTKGGPTGGHWEFEPRKEK
jgi:hypothetical protein